MDGATATYSFLRVALKSRIGTRGIRVDLQISIDSQSLLGKILIYGTMNPIICWRSCRMVD